MPHMTCPGERYMASALQARVAQPLLLCEAALRCEARAPAVHCFGSANVRGALAIAAIQDSTTKSLKANQKNPSVESLQVERPFVVVNEQDLRLQSENPKP